MKLSYTSEDLNRAKETNLVELARRLGYTPVKCGRCYSLKEMDSMRIYNEKHGIAGVVQDRKRVEPKLILLLNMVMQIMYRKQYTCCWIFRG